MRDLTDRQRQVLEVVIDHVLEHHTHATIRVIGERLGIRSTAGVSGHLEALARKGYLAFVAGRGDVKRTWRALRHPDGTPFDIAVDWP